MAGKLNVSPATVRNHVQNIFGKLGVHSRLEAVADATARGLL
jgi:DNA-binding NarL/FixJ family response regulator